MIFQYLSFNLHVCAAVGGIAGTAAMLSSGGNPFATGAITAGTGEYTSQWLRAASGERENIDGVNVAGQAVVGGVFGKLGGPNIKGVTTNRNSMQAVSGSTFTKLANGTIQNFSGSTAGKILTTQLVNGMPQSIVTGAISNQNLQSAINSLVRQIQSLQKQLDKLKSSQKKN